MKKNYLVFFEIKLNRNSSVHHLSLAFRSRSERDLVYKYIHQLSLIIICPETFNYKKRSYKKFSQTEWFSGDNCYVLTELEKSKFTEFIVIIFEDIEKDYVLRSINNILNKENFILVDDFIFGDKVICYPRSIQNYI